MQVISGGNGSNGAVRPQSANGHFPAGFLWGVSTAAHQVEGGNHNNQWSEWERAGHIKSREFVGSACDWWNNPEPDFDLAAKLGINALRLSVEWSRIEPEPGRFDVYALDRYREMLQGLHRRGIQPMVCLHHFTNPLWFERQGSFLAPDAGALFERFTRRVVDHLGDLCQFWLTMNEPNVYAAMGYVLGEFPPGHRGEVLNAIRVVTALAEAHARAYSAIHQLQPHAQVGWAHNFVVFEPADPASPLDRMVTRMLDELFNAIFLRLVENGRLALPLRFLQKNTVAIQQSCDYVGLNVYSRFHVAFDSAMTSRLCARVYVPAHVPQGDHGVEQPYGEAYPGAIRAAVKRVEILRKPIYILENGVPDAKDRIRPWLIASATSELANLIAEGHDIRGYFHWTLTDNFEWSEGWKLRFGLVALDRATQKRTLRRSAHLYSAIARNNALLPEIVREYFPAGIQPESDRGS
jgi:beta-glucosidase